MALTVAGCAPALALPQLQAWTAAGRPPPPPQAACPFVAKVDLRRIAIEQAGRIRDPGGGVSRFDEIRIPASSPHRPSADAPVVLRAVEPPGGMYSNTVWSVVWKEPDGVWWFWRQNRDPSVYPMPKPPPPADTPEGRAYAEKRARGELVVDPAPDEERWPPATGRLRPQQAKALDDALAAPCRAWEPDIWPMHPPIRGARSPSRPPPQDWTPIFVELKEPGRPARRISGPLDRRSYVGTIARIAYGPSGAP